MITHSTLLRASREHVERLAAWLQVSTEGTDYELARRVLAAIQAAPVDRAPYHCRARAL